MSLPYPAATVIDGDHSVVTPCSLPEFEAPIPGVETEYIFTQRFRISRNDYNAGIIAGSLPVTLGTPHADYPSFVLVEESARKDIGVGGIVEFVRKYARTPATHYDWQTMNYSFIGLSGTNSLAAPFVPNRGRFSQSVTSRIQFDYFLCLAGAPTVTDPITGQNFAPVSPGAIPKIYAMQYCQQTKVGNAIIGGIAYPVEALNQDSGTGGLASQTVPTLEQYYSSNFGSGGWGIGILPDAYKNGWGATMSFQKILPDYTFTGSPGAYSGHFAGVIADVAPFQTVLGGLIPAEDSTIDRWLGPIFVRRSRYILAQ